MPRRGATTSSSTTTSARSGSSTTTATTWATAGSRCAASGCSKRCAIRTSCPTTSEDVAICRTYRPLSRDSARHPLRAGGGGRPLLVRSVVLDVAAVRLPRPLQLLDVPRPRRTRARSCRWRRRASWDRCSACGSRRTTSTSSAHDEALMVLRRIVGGAPGRRSRAAPRDARRRAAPAPATPVVTQRALPVRQRQALQGVPRKAA